MSGIAVSVGPKPHARGDTSKTSGGGAAHAPIGIVPPAEGAQIALAHSMLATHDAPTGFGAAHVAGCIPALQ
jgi:hypothetical protein